MLKVYPSIGHDVGEEIQITGIAETSAPASLGILPSDTDINLPVWRGVLINAVAVCHGVLQVVKVLTKVFSPTKFSEGHIFNDPGGGEPATGGGGPPHYRIPPSGYRVIALPPAWGTTGSGPEVFRSGAAAGAFRFASST